MVRGGSGVYSVPVSKIVFLKKKNVEYRRVRIMQTKVENHININELCSIRLITARHHRRRLRTVQLRICGERISGVRQGTRGPTYALQSPPTAVR